jgi:ferredoxin-NADP reductase
MNVTFDHVENTAENIKTFYFKPEKPVDYIAGQFTELYLAHDSPDNRGIRRWFTLSSAPTSPLLSITTKFSTQQSSTFKQTLAKLAPGSPLKLAQPMGDFVLPKDASRPLVFVAGGIGVTPMHSMIQYLHDRNETRTIHLMYAVTKAEELAFQKLFQNANIQLTTIIKDPPAGYTGESGSLSAERIISIAKPQPNALFYLSGPEPMVEAFTKDLAGSGINKHNILTDYFPGYQKF